MNDTRFLRSKLHNNLNSLDDNYKTGPAYRFSSLDAFSIHESQRANSYEDLFTVTAKSKGSLRSGTDFRAGRRAGNVFCEIGRPRGFSKRTKLLIAFAVVVVVIVIICLVVAISAIGKNGSSSNAGKFKCCTAQPRIRYSGFVISSWSVAKMLNCSYHQLMHNA